MITKEQYRNSVLAHKLSVKIGLQRVIDDLQKRADNHDDDKLEGETLDSFYEISGKTNQTLGAIIPELGYSCWPIINNTAITDDEYDYQKLMKKR